MRLRALDWQPSRRQLRQFAWGTALFLAVLSWPGGDSYWSLSLRLAAALLFAIGTVLPSVLRWPYLSLLLVLCLFVWFFHRILQAFSLSPAPRRARTREPKPFHERHDHEPATGTHG